MLFSGVPNRRNFIRRLHPDVLRQVGVQRGRKALGAHREFRVKDSDIPERVHARVCATRKYNLCRGSGESLHSFVQLLFHGNGIRLYLRAEIARPVIAHDQTDSSHALSSEENTEDDDARQK